MTPVPDRPAAAPASPGPGPAQPPGAEPDAHRLAVAAEFRRLAEAGGLDLPLPGSGRTRERWSALTALAERDLALARLCEGHTDALAILAELTALGADAVPRPQPGQLWGVWAAEPPGTTLHAHRRADGGWRLDGAKPYCSGARICTDALVSVREGERRLLFAVRTGPGVDPVPDSWPAAGMNASDTLDLRFTDVPATLVGADRAYLDRPGFHHGGIGVAACWYGGAKGVAARLMEAVAAHPEPHALAHLGAVDARLQALSALLDRAADEVDADPGDKHGRAALRAMRVRAAAEAAASSALRHVGRALGAGPLGHEREHARRVADLTVYIRQHHGERDLAALGQALVDAAGSAR